MAASTKITSIKDIQARQLAIQQELETSKEAATQTLRTASNEAQTFVLRDVVLPAAGIALAGYLTVKVVGALLAEKPQQPDIQTNQLTENHSAQPVRTTQQVRPQPTAPAKPFYQSLLRLGSLLIPAGRAIVEVIQKERAQ